MWSTIELREIRTFIVLSEELHFGRAAERLELTPSRISQVVRTLETRLGGRLFDRTSRRVALTPLGEQLLERAGPVYEQLEVCAQGDPRSRDRNRGHAADRHVHADQRRPTAG